MESPSEWYDGVVGQVGTYKAILSQKDHKKHRFDLLIRVAKRVASFSPTCGECQNSQGEITMLVKDLSFLLHSPKEKRKSHAKVLKIIVKHLQKHHKLVTEGQNRTMGMTLGVGIGAGVGAGVSAAFDTSYNGLAVVLGIFVGSAIGRALDAKAKREGRLI